MRACGMGAYAFYLAVRFYMTDEFKFSSQTVADKFFCDNKNWFDTKLLVDCYANDYCKEMSNDSYSKFMKRILQEQNIISNHIVHIGRVLGSADLELLENEKSGTLDMGNWAADVHKRCYSIKMPIKSLRRAAGFVLADGMHHNIRTTVEPDPEDAELLDKVFPFVKGCLAAVLAAKEAETDGSQSYLNTAVCFLELLGHLALVFLQDAAAMVVLHPERGDNTMYKHLPVLKSEAFGRYRDKMEQALVNDECPTDYKLEACLPGLDQRFQTLEGRMGSMERGMHTSETKVVTTVQDEGQKTRDAIAFGLEAAADTFRRGGGGTAVSQQQVQRLATMADRAGGGSAPTDHQFYARHKSVQSFYNEFYGLGDFNLIPITGGGLLAMEKKFGAKWRKTVRGGAKHMSRLKALMQAIANMATEGDSVDRSIGIIELAFQDKGAEGGKQGLRATWSTS